MVRQQLYNEDGDPVRVSTVTRRTGTSRNDDWSTGGGDGHLIMIPLVILFGLSLYWASKGCGYWGEYLTYILSHIWSIPTLIGVIACLMLLYALFKMVLYAFYSPREPRIDGEDEDEDE